MNILKLAPITLCILLVTFAFGTKATKDTKEIRETTTSTGDYITIATPSEVRTNGTNGSDGSTMYLKCQFLVVPPAPTEKEIEEENQPPKAIF